MVTQRHLTRIKLRHLLVFVEDRGWCEQSLRLALTLFQLTLRSVCQVVNIDCSAVQLFIISVTVRFLGAIPTPSAQAA